MIISDKIGIKTGHELGQSENGLTSTRDLSSHSHISSMQTNMGGDPHTFYLV